MGPAILTAMLYFNKSPAELLTSYSHVGHRLPLPFSSTQVEYHAEWSTTEVCFMNFGHKWISEHVFVEKLFVIQLSIASF